MNKLSEILQLAELFYKTAMQALAGPEASTMPDDPEAEGTDAPIVQRFANLVEATDNVELYKKLKKYFDLYQSYVKALETGARSEDDETFIDIGEALNNAWEVVINDPYLNLEADDPDYTEDLPPHEIVNLIQELLASANEKKHAKGASLGISKEEMDAAEQAVQKDMNLPQGAKDVRNKLDEKQRKVYDEKIHKQLGYQKKFREKLQTIKDLGVENLTQKRAILKQQIESATTPDERKELEMRFKNMPDPQLLLNHQAARKKQYDIMWKDDKRRTEYVAKAIKRLQDHREEHDDAMKIIEDIKNTQDPASRKRLMDKLVKLEEKVMEQQKINLDDEFIRNSPEIMRRLNPEEIIKKYVGRADRIKNEKIRETESRVALKLEGNISGLVLTFQQQLSSFVNDTKKKLQKIIDSKGYVDPFFSSYVTNLSGAAAAVQTDPSPENKNKLQKAQEAILGAVKTYKETNPLVVATNAKLKPWVSLKEELQQLVGHSGKTKVLRTPWFHTSPIPEDKKPILQALTIKCDQGVAELSGFAPAIAKVLEQISGKLKEKL